VEQRQCLQANHLHLRETLTSLDLVNCPNVTAEAKQALRPAIPNLTIEG
jgi:hypothetical protein